MKVAKGTVFKLKSGNLADEETIIINSLEELLKIVKREWSITINDRGSNEFEIIINN